MKRTLYLYLPKDLVPAFSLGLVGFTFVHFTGRILQLTERFVNKGIPLETIHRLFFLHFPAFLVLTIPMAFNRPSSDNEITVLKASGAIPDQMIPPVLLPVRLRRGIDRLRPKSREEGGIRG